MRNNVGGSFRPWRHEFCEARRVVEAPGFVRRTTAHEGIGVGQDLQPLRLEGMQINGLDEVETREILGVISASAAQHLEQRQWREAGILAGAGPAERADRHGAGVEIEDVEEVSRLVASGDGQQLVDGEIDVFGSGRDLRAYRGGGQFTITRMTAGPASVPAFTRNR